MKSDKGFYIGDICYALSDVIYEKFWGGVYSYADGEFEIDGYSFAVGSTAYGDGIHYDSDCHKYPVDAGVIGLVPLELVSKESKFGFVFDVPGEAEFKCKDGVFDITLPRDVSIHIDTR